MTKPTPAAAKNLLALIEACAAHNLSVSYTSLTDEFSSLVWEDGFNKTHRVEIMCYNCGVVVGKATDTDEPDGARVWFIPELSDDLPPATTRPLLLTLDESLEYVRHYIWANHNV
jgi:hypothetical protein